jgi:hypothetical protein
VFDGRCGTTRWALGGYTSKDGHAFFAFRRRSGDTSWDIVSSTSDLGAVCAVPAALLRVWNEAPEEC